MKKISDNKRIALFPGSFDPFTVGHESIVDRALPLFDEIVVAVGINDAKKSLMTVDDRIRFIQSVYAREPRVRVVGYRGLTVDAARLYGAGCILRGVRMIQDFEFEKNLAEVNRSLSGIDTVLLYTLPQLSHVSSSIVRELIGYGQNIDDFLPLKGDKSLIPVKDKE
jgi:pantetheine-phosphate adenylyltransferase